MDLDLKYAVQGCTLQPVAYSSRGMEMLE